MLTTRTSSCVDVKYQNKKGSLLLPLPHVTARLLPLRMGESRRGSRSEAMGYISAFMDRIQDFKTARMSSLQATPRAMPRVSIETLRHGRSPLPQTPKLDITRESFRNEAIRDYYG